MVQRKGTCSLRNLYPVESSPEPHSEILHPKEDPACRAQQSPGGWASRSVLYCSVLFFFFTHLPVCQCDFLREPAGNCRVTVRACACVCVHVCVCLCVCACTRTSANSSPTPHLPCFLHCHLWRIDCQRWTKDYLRD